MNRLAYIGLLSLTSLCLPSVASAADFFVKRLATGFHLPVYATTAPGDDDRIFVVQLGGLASHETDGDPNTSALGRIMIYDRTTGSVNSTPFLEIPDTDLTDPVTFEPEVGLWALAFHPDYQNNGRFFVNVAVDNGGIPSDFGASPFSSMIREYAVSSNADLANASPTQTILEIVQPSFNHNGSWMGFNPIANAANDNTQYLYITMGDGGEQHDPNNRGQRLDDLFGSVLRIDVDGAPDPGKNYSIPDSNPFAGSDRVANEIWNYGLRNPWQASFDRETGDLWIGDVGQGRREEINFQPADSTGGENYGWRLREGSVATPTGGVGGPEPANNVDPIYDYLHLGLGTPGFEGNSTAGGRVYRGASNDLYGQFIFADSRSGEVWSFDPADPYGTVDRLKLNPAFTPDEGVIDYVVSIGEDNQGNLLIVDYDGELYQVFANLQLKLLVNRDTGIMTLENQTGETLDVLSYSITSASGAITPDSLTPITGNYDSSLTGDGSFDNNDAWQITSSAGSLTEFGEASTGDAGSLLDAAQYNLGTAWTKSIYEDFEITVTLGDGSEVAAIVEFSGNSGSPFERGDLSFSGGIGPEDWDIFLANHFSQFPDMSAAESYALGDLDGDGDNDFTDFRLFQADYVAEHGLEAFNQLLQVPEPGSLALTMYAVISLALGTRYRSSWSVKNDNLLSRPTLCAVTVIGVVSLATTQSQASLTHLYTFNQGVQDTVGSAHGTLFGNATTNSAGELVLSGSSADYLSLDGPAINISSYTDVTFETWFTADSFSTWQRVFDFGDRTVPAGQQGYIYYTAIGGNGGGLGVYANNGNRTEAPHGSLQTDTLYHLAMVIDDDANGGADELTLYLNGQEFATVGHAKTLGLVSDNFAYIGKSLVAVDPNFHGTLDEFRIWDHALTAGEIQNNFTDGPTPLATLRLEVNTVSGAASIVSDSAMPAPIDYYAIRSSSGSLNLEGWASLDSQGIDTIGAETGQSWDEGLQLDASTLGELFLLGASSVADGSPLNLGQPFDPAVFGLGEPGDLTFEFGVQGGGLITGQVDYVTPTLPAGDFDGDLDVDGADFLRWQRGLSFSPLSGSDLAVWQANYGTMAAAASAIPEPCALGLLLAGVGILCPGRLHSI